MKQNNNKKQPSEILKRRKLSNKPIIVGVASLLTVVAIIAIVLISTGKPQSQKETEGKNEKKDIVSIQIISGSLVDEQQYNVWFEVNCDRQDGTISMAPSVGYIIGLNNENDEIMQLDVIDVKDINLYTYIWIVESANESIVGCVDVKYEDTLQIKTASIYSIFYDGAIGFLDRDQYNEYSNLPPAPETEEK